VDESTSAKYDLGMPGFIIRIVGISLTFAGCVCANSSGQDLVIGALEDHPGYYAGEPNFREVRVLFRKNGSDWQPFPSDCPDQNCLKTIVSEYPAEINWTIAFDGKSLGGVTSRNPKDFGWYASVGQQEICNTNSVPSVGERSSMFAGWFDAPVYRPLVAISRPYFKDPESWKPAPLPDHLVQLLRREFRNKFPKVMNCGSPNENIPKPWPYASKDIKVHKSYSSSNRWSIAELVLEEYRCDGPSEESDDPFSSQWFAVSPGNEVKFLGQGMWLVDAGDYDKDGKSELLFSIAGYNRGGYELFYDDFRRHVTFEYNYH
jgi:hypothetical protein